MIKKIKNFICKIFGIKQCACKDEHLELYEDIPEPEIPVHKAEKINRKEFSVKKLSTENNELYGSVKPTEISKLILEGPEEQLKLTQNTQPAILVVSYSIFSVLKKECKFDFSLV